MVLPWDKVVIVINSMSEFLEHTLYFNNTRSRNRRRCHAKSNRLTPGECLLGTESCGGVAHINLPSGVNADSRPCSTQISED